MTRVGPHNREAGDPGGVEQDVAGAGLHGRSQRKPNSFGPGSRESGLRDRRFHDAPHDQDARAKAFESRMADKVKGDGRDKPAGQDTRAASGKAGRSADASTGSAAASAARHSADEGSRHESSLLGLFQPVFGRDAGDDHGDGKPDDREGPRLLAIAEPPPDSFSLLFAAPAAAPSQTVAPPGTLSPERGGATADRVAGVAARVEAAIEAELSSGGPPRFSLAIPVEAMGDGLVGVTVTLGPEGLDILLTRTGLAASEDLVQAASALAARLQRRFTRQAVRVLETIVDEPASAALPAEGWAALSDVFGRRGA